MAEEGTGSVDDDGLFVDAFTVVIHGFALRPLLRMYGKLAVSRIP